MASNRSIPLFISTLVSFLFFNAKVGTIINLRNIVNYQNLPKGLLKSDIWLAKCLKFLTLLLSSGFLFVFFLSNLCFGTFGEIVIFCFGSTSLSAFLYCYKNSNVNKDIFYS